jgi:hypothetical protein
LEAAIGRLSRPDQWLKWLGDFEARESKGGFEDCVPHEPDACLHAQLPFSTELARIAINKPCLLGQIRPEV